MDINRLIEITGKELLDEMIGLRLGFDLPVVISVTAKPAELHFLKDGKSNNALFLELDIELQPDAVDVVPGQLVLKAGWNKFGTAAREMQFFKKFAEQNDLPGVVKCFGTKWLQKISGDLTAYYRPDEDHLRQYKGAMKVLANLHARWWNHSDLGRGELAYQWTEESLTPIIGIANDAFVEKIEACPLQWSSSEITTISSVLSNLQPLLLLHVKAGGPMCVGHGDAALWNFLIDRDEAKPPRLVDFQLWSVFPPAWDIAYMIVLLWPKEFREAHGDKMITVYRQTLAAVGISYSTKEFLTDLRVCIVALVALVLVNWRLGFWAEDESKERLRGVLVAFQQYDCNRLFD